MSVMRWVVCKSVLIDANLEGMVALATGALSDIFWSFFIFQRELLRFIKSWVLMGVLSLWWTAGNVSK